MVKSTVTEALVRRLVDEDFSLQDIDDIDFAEIPKILKDSKV